MCAIVDANVVSEIFGSNLPPAGEKFFDWLNQGSGRLIVGGKLLEELGQSSADFRAWASVAVGAGKLQIVNKNVVDTKTNHIQSHGICKSNDPHVIALAQVSGARLLYSNDGNLQQDFKNKSLIDKPRGKVYSTNRSGSFQLSHDRLLKDKNLCRL